MLIECGLLSLTSFLVAEVIYSTGLSKLKIFFSFQNMKSASVNIKKVANKIGDKGMSGIVISFGNKIFNFHHSRVGWILAALSVAFANISLLAVSIGLIIHHAIRERKLF